MENNEVAKLTNEDVTDAYMWLMYNKTHMNRYAWDSAMNNVCKEMERRRIEPPREEDYK